MTLAVFFFIPKNFAVKLISEKLYKTVHFWVESLDNWCSFRIIKIADSHKYWKSRRKFRLWFIQVMKSRNESKRIILWNYLQFMDDLNNEQYLTPSAWELICAQHVFFFLKWSSSLSLLLLDMVVFRFSFQTLSIIKII